MLLVDNPARIAEHQVFNPSRPQSGILRDERVDGFARPSPDANHPRFPRVHPGGQRVSTRYNPDMIRAIDVSDLPEPLVEAIESLVNTYRHKIGAASNPPQRRPFGWLKGQWELPETFFDPLPDDVVDAVKMTGK